MPRDDLGPDGLPKRPCPPGYEVVGNVNQWFMFEPDSVRPRDADPFAEFTIQQFFDRVQPEPMEWLWPGRIPLGKLSLLAGDPGLGKSLLTIDMAARVSQGAPWPDALAPGEYGPPRPMPKGSVLILSAEDDMRDTILPRLKKAGARLDWIETLWGVSGRDIRNMKTRIWKRPLELPADVRAIERMLCERPSHPEPEPGSNIPWVPKFRLVIIDPLPAFFPAGTGNDNVTVRKMLQPLVDLAAHYRTAIVGVTHLNKTVSQPGQYRTLGSVWPSVPPPAPCGASRPTATTPRSGCWCR